MTRAAAGGRNGPAPKVASTRSKAVRGMLGRGAKRDGEREREREREAERERGRERQRERGARVVSGGGGKRVCVNLVKQLREELCQFRCSGPAPIHRRVFQAKKTSTSDFL